MFHSKLNCLSELLSRIYLMLCYFTQSLLVPQIWGTGREYLFKSNLCSLICDQVMSGVYFFNARTHQAKQFVLNIKHDYYRQEAET